jgi:hypothetical protein
MAITTTTLAAALDANSVIFRPTATTGASAEGYAKINDEWMVVTAIVGGSIEVRQRGALGSKSTSHALYSPVLFCLGTDIATPGPAFGFGAHTRRRDVVSYGASGAIALPTRDTVALITKTGTLAAMTLADPSDVPDGTMLIVASTTALAHTITFTTNGPDGTVNTQKLTFGNLKGYSVTFMAYKGLWAEVNVARTLTHTAAVSASATA